MIRCRALIVGSLLAAAAWPLIPAQAQDAGKSLEQRFAAPGMEARPRVRWWWPGGAVDDAEIRREIDLLADTGFAGAEIQSFTPNFVPLTPDEKAHVNDYAEPPFFAHIRAAGEAARARGLGLDYTLGSAWPSGGGRAPPEKALVELTMAQTSVQGGTKGPITLTMPKRTKRLGALSYFDPRTKAPEFADWGKRLDARAKVVAVVAMKGAAPQLRKAQATAGFTLSPWSDVIQAGALDPASRIVLTDKLRDDGTLDWTPPPGDWQVFVFKQYASDIGVMGAAGQGPQLILDHLDPSAFAAHAARVGDPLGRNPVGMRSTFVDSLELMQDIQWGPDFLNAFRARRGYDLTPWLPFVLQPGWMQAWGERYSPPYYDAAGGDLAERVRADYRRTLSDLMIEGFIQPFVAWNHAHGLKAKFQAHGGAFDILRGYGLVDIPETEDLVHGGDPLFMRFARSAADLYGRPIVSAESLVWANRPYEVTPDEMRRRVDLIIAGGVNDMILHGFDYRFHADDWPGWHAFQPSPFSGGFSSMLAETNPVWPALKPLAAYIARLQTVMQAGKPVVPVAYFYGRYGYYVGIEDDGAGKQAAEKAFLAGGYDFDRINPDSIAQARVEQRQLVAQSGQRYPVLVLPPIDGIRADTAEAIARFAKAGLPVVFTDRAPSRDEGMQDMTRRDSRVRRAIAAAIKAGAKVVPAGGVVDALRSAAIPANLRFGGDASDIVFVQRQVGSRTATSLVNRAATPRTVSLILPGNGGVSRWSSMDGSVTQLPSEAAEGGTRLSLSLGAQDSALLVLDPATSSATPANRTVVGRSVLPADGWSLRVDGHAARQPYAHDFGAVRLADWRETPDLARFAGTAAYRRSFTMEPGWLAQGTRVMLDLGAVHDMASISVNGHALPPLITAPFRVDITDGLRAGANDLVVTVANTPQNAMINAKDPSYAKLRPVPAGLVGPVALEAER
jgi:hypothetical protein